MKASDHNPVFDRIPPQNVDAERSVLGAMPWQIVTGDALTVLRDMPDEGVNCCVTSPPYWGLRDYGVVGQLGLEATPELYVERMTAVFREVRRVLKSDGTLWLNIGDSYAANNRSGRDESPGVGATQAMAPTRTAVKWHAGDGSKFKWTLPGGQKPKDLVGIPWMLAFALRADGWWLRQDIIWHKPNPMPESVRDRCTKAHEYVFLLTKSTRYWFDAKAITEPSMGYENRNGFRGENDGPTHYANQPAVPGNSSKFLRTTNGKHSTQDAQSAGRRIVENVKTARANGADHDAPWGETRNKRSVWTVNTQGFPEAHFATFPEALVLPCILAGCPVGGTVIDPFAGSGTVGVVAMKHDRRFIGIELNPTYCEMARRRITESEPLWARVTP